MENVRKFPKDFFKKDRSNIKTKEKTKIYPIKWSKKILKGNLKNEIIVTKPVK